MFGAWIHIVGWLLVLALVVFLALPPQGYVEGRRTRFVERTGAYVDPVFVDVIDRDTRRLLRWCAGLFLVVEITAELSYRLNVAYDVIIFNSRFFQIPLLGLGLAALGVVRLRSAGREFPVPVSRSAVARPRRVALSDYVSVHLQIVTWLAVTCAAALALSVAINADGGGVDRWWALFGVGDAVVTLGMAAFTAWFATAMCARPTPAVDASHLYLQDAWRSSAISLAYGLVCVSAFLSSLALMGAATAQWLEPPLILLFIAGIGTVAIGQRDRFRRRLWRTLRPGQVLLPGESVPPAYGAGA